MKFISSVILATSFALAGAVAAQSTDLLVADPSARVMRGRVGGVFTTAATLPNPGLRVRVDVDNRHLVVADVSLGLLHVDPSTGTIARTVHKGAPFAFALSALFVDRAGDYWVADVTPPFTAKPERTELYHVTRAGGVVTSITTMLYRSITSIVTDPSTGDLLFADSPPNAFASILHVDPVTRSVKHVVGVPPAMQLVTDLAVDPHRPLAYVFGGPGDSLYAYDPVARRIASTLASGLPFVSGVADRAPLASGALLYAGDGNGRIHAFDRNGTAVGTTAPGARPNAIALDRSRNLATQAAGTPGDYGLRVSFPTQAGNPFVAVCGLSGFSPGIPLADGRVIPINVDAATLASLGGALAPLFAGNVGRLDARGAAVATLRVGALARLAPGLRIWFAAVALDPTAPLGIADVSAPLVFAP